MAVDVPPKPGKPAKRNQKKTRVLDLKARRCGKLRKKRKQVGSYKATGVGEVAGKITMVNHHAAIVVYVNKIPLPATPTNPPPSQRSPAGLQTS